MNSISVSTRLAKVVGTLYPISYDYCPNPTRMNKPATKPFELICSRSFCVDLHLGTYFLYTFIPSEAKKPWWKQ